MVCVGRNYLEHIRELGNETPDEMVIFNKPNSSISKTLYAVRDGGYDLMMRKPSRILAGIQAFMSLEDGDIIMTGTPKGVGQVTAGESFVGRVLTADRELISQQWQIE